ncbi:hypothetical protein BJ138DRAFT_256042 [Hygrophoropsis aurantiaca]|uniref:Uncharacterized protein n=1 Tax=Hygrophoropsis aurantiaca TaxID=72124 RepID=A0ACB8A826_9AGAM|nr:hypothetical protein BJ138DRAFT_256042 [Hygrophoropsis aurantiaca]
MRFILSSEHVRNTTVTNEHGQVVYRTDTPFKIGSRTTTVLKIRPNYADADMRDQFAVLGAIQWHYIASSIFRFGGQEIQANEFIPASGILRRTRTFMGPDGRSYKWKLDFKVVVLYLNDGSKTEVARYHRRSLGIIGKKHDPYLEIFSHGEGILDVLILTFIYVEKLRMDKERNARRSASGGGP